MKYMTVLFFFTIFESNLKRQMQKFRNTLLFMFKNVEQRLMCG